MHEVADDFASTEIQLWCELEEDQAKLGENHPQIAMRLGKLSELYQSAGIYPAAETLRLRAVEILRQAYGERDVRHTEGLIELARLYRASGAFQAAETLYREVLENLCVPPVTDHSRYITTLIEQCYTAALIETSDLYRAMGDYPSAAPLLKEAVEIVRRQQGEESLDFAFALHELGGFYLSSGDFAAAKEHFRQALEIDRATRDEEDPDIAASMNNLAHVHLTLGEYADAECLLQEAMRIVRGARGRNHPDNASIMTPLSRNRRIV
jgi:tetratricopeptide (TPR) repeat protein